MEYSPGRSFIRPGTELSQSGGPQSYQSIKGGRARRSRTEGSLAQSLSLDSDSALLGGSSAGSSMGRTRETKVLAKSFTSTVFPTRALYVDHDSSEEEEDEDIQSKIFGQRPSRSSLDHSEKVGLATPGQHERRTAGDSESSRTLYGRANSAPIGKMVLPPIEPTPAEHSPLLASPAPSSFPETPTRDGDPRTDGDPFHRVVFPSSTAIEELSRREEPRGGEQPKSILKNSSPQDEKKRIYIAGVSIGGTDEPSISPGAASSGVDDFYSSPTYPPPVYGPDFKEEAVPPSVESQKNTTFLRNLKNTLPSYRIILYCVSVTLAHSLLSFVWPILAQPARDFLNTGFNAHSVSWATTVPD